MREFINIIESKILEVDRGGDVERDVLDDLEQDNFDNDQLDLFQEIPTLHPKLPKGYSVVGQMGTYFILRKAVEGTDETMLVIIDKNKPIGWVGLLPLNSQNVEYPARLRTMGATLNGTGLQVLSVFIDAPYRGQNLGPKLYEFILRNICDYIVSDYTHTPGGESLWRRLRNSRKFDVEVWDEGKTSSRRRWGGRDWNNVYDSNKSFFLIPWVTLRGKADKIAGPEDDWEQGAEH